MLTARASSIPVNRTRSPGLTTPARFSPIPGPQNTYPSHPACGPHSISLTATSCWRPDRLTSVRLTSVSLAAMAATGPTQVQDSACQQEAPDRAGPENHREKHIREPSRAIGQRRASPAPPLPPPLVRTSREREGRRPSSTPMVEMAARGSCTDCKVRLT